MSNAAVQTVFSEGKKYITNKYLCVQSKNILRKKMLHLVHFDINIFWQNIESLKYYAFIFRIRLRGSLRLRLRNIEFETIIVLHERKPTLQGKQIK
jgi:hypothetical protein